MVKDVPTLPDEEENIVPIFNIFSYKLYFYDSEV